jgi:hypothetical protein
MGVTANQIVELSRSVGKPIIGLVDSLEVRGTCHEAELIYQKSGLTLLSDSPLRRQFPLNNMPHARGSIVFWFQLMPIRLLSVILLGYYGDSACVTTRG